MIKTIARDCGRSVTFCVPGLKGGWGKGKEIQNGVCFTLTFVWMELDGCVGLAVQV